MTGSRLSSALGFTPLNGTDVELTYSGTVPRQRPGDG